MLSSVRANNEEFESLNSWRWRLDLTKELNDWRLIELIFDVVFMPSRDNIQSVLA